MTLLLQNTTGDTGEVYVGQQQMHRLSQQYRLFRACSAMHAVTWLKGQSLLIGVVVGRPKAGSHSIAHRRKVQYAPSLPHGWWQCRLLLWVTNKVSHALLYSVLQDTCLC